MSSRVLTAVAWPYANGPRHIGHVSGFGVPSDVFSRYRRMVGDQVLMVSGTDEHGTPIQVQADAEGLTARAARRQVQPGDRRGPAGPRAVLRPVHPDHHEQPLRGGAGAVPGAVPQRLRRAARPPWGRSARPPAARCPTATSRAPARSAGTTRARGDQCDNCGNQLDPADLINPRSKINGETPAVRRDRALLARPAGVRRVAGLLAGHPHRLAAERAQVRHQPGRRPASRGPSPATSTGASRFRWTAGGTSR